MGGLINIECLILVSAPPLHFLFWSTAAAISNTYQCANGIYFVLASGAKEEARVRVRVRVNRSHGGIVGTAFDKNV